ncbi:MAG: hypothetical protein KGH50_03640 [Candidatus Micrarchaeota archaeon]|nr:hypothetical protein [Candidatus Micrarchaeota archaeon]
MRVQSHTAPAELVVGSRAELLSAIRSIGVKPPKAFLKLNDPKYSLRREEYGGIGCAIQASVDLRSEFARLVRMHEIIPKNSPKPYALIVDRESYRVHGYAMEFIPGKSLAHYFYSQPEAARAYLKSAVRLVKELHANGFAHHDLDPVNMMITPKGKVVLIDPDPTVSGASPASFDVKAICRMHNQLNAWMMEKDRLQKVPKVA